MAINKTLILFGNAASKEMAKNYLENMPQVKRIDMLPNGQLRVLLHAEIPESEWVFQIKQSGVCGFCFA